MNKHTQLSLLTFLGVGLIIFSVGFIGINISIKYIENNFIQLQIDVNKRQAERMAFYIDNEIKKGYSLDSVKNSFQTSIVGTEHDKGFLCLYDHKQMMLISHPNPNAIGMSFTEDFTFKYTQSGSSQYIGDVYSQNNPIGGIFTQGPMRTDIIYTIPIEGTNWYLNVHENIEAISSELKQIKKRYILGALLLGVLIAVLASITARRISRNYEKQIEQKNLEIIKQRDEIAEKNRAITDSINYAERIQSATLPNKQILDSVLTDNFIFYLPKDIVSGDFYWFSKTEKSIVVAAADCTGHGVPGAFMSMLGLTLLNEIVNHQQIDSAELILDELRKGIKTSVTQNGSAVEANDGMDISLCIIDNEKKTLQYAGANNPLYLFRNNLELNQHELTELKADRMPIGKHPKDREPFTSKQVSLQKDDVIYMFSDGYVSQFGGETGGTFKSKQLKELLLSIQNRPLSAQKEIICERLKNWQGNYDQVDDILVMAFKV